MTLSGNAGKRHPPLDGKNQRRGVYERNTIGANAPGIGKECGRPGPGVIFFGSVFGLHSYVNVPEFQGFSHSHPLFGGA